MVYGQCLVTFPSTINQKLVKMAHIAAYLRAGIIPVVTGISVPVFITKVAQDVKLIEQRKEGIPLLTPLNIQRIGRARRCPAEAEFGGLRNHEKTQHALKMSEYNQSLVVATQKKKKNNNSYMTRSL